MPQEQRKQKSQAQKNPEKPEGNAWAHWEYAPDEWELFDRIDWRSVVRRYLLTSALGILGFLLVVALFFWLTTIHTEVATTIANFAFVAMLFSAFFLLYLMVPGTAFRKARKRHKARQNSSQPYKVTLSHKGMWLAGTYFPFTGTGVENRELGVTLREVRLTSEPTTLQFRVEYRISNSANTLNRTEINRETVHLLVPRAHESEAEYVAQLFRTEVVEAREQAAKRAHDALVNPPEPD